MKQTFTKEFMEANCGCYSMEQLAECSFMKLPEITLESIIHSEIRLKDKFWFICKKLATKEENQQIAIRCAEIVLPIYEKRYPENKAPREAIEAAKSYLAGHISLVQLIAKRRAAYAAAYAAYAAAADVATAVGNSETSRRSMQLQTADLVRSLIPRPDKMVDEYEHTLKLKAFL